MQTEPTSTHTNGADGDPYPAGALPASAPAAALGLEEKFERVTLEQLAPSHTNPRTHFNEGRIAEIAASMRELGVLQPLIVRPHPDHRKPTRRGVIAVDRFEIVAGETRYRAAKVAGLATVPVIVRDYSNEQVLEAQLIENEHRTDLRPLELARGYRALITANPDKHSAASIGARLGMSAEWVWDRLSLLKLTAEATQLLDEDRIALGHAILLARLKPEDQKRTIAPPSRSFPSTNSGLWVYEEAGLDLEHPGKLAKKESKFDGLKPKSIRELDQWIAEHVRFDVAHAAQAQPLAFEETAALVETAAAAPGRRRKVIAITYDYRVKDDAKDEDERTYGREAWVRADGLEKSKTCEHSVLGVVMAGPGRGGTLQVCVARDRCTTHFAAVVKAREKSAKLRASGDTAKADKSDQKQESEYDRRNRLAADLQRRWDALKPHAVAAVVAKIKNTPITGSLLTRVLDHYVQADLRQVLPLLGASKITGANFARAVAVAEVLDADYSAQNFASVAKKYGVDLKALEKQHAPAPAAAEAKKGKGKK